MPTIKDVTPQEWYDTLASGTVKRVPGVMANGDARCCLGVLAEMQGYDVCELDPDTQKSVNALEILGMRPDWLPKALLPALTLRNDAHEDGDGWSDPDDNPYGVLACIRSDLL